MSEPVQLGLIPTTAFRRGVRRMARRGRSLDKLDIVIGLLRAREPLPLANKDHTLTGDRRGFRACHIEPDWVLVYKVDSGRLVLVLTDTGTHDDLGW